VLLLIGLTRHAAAQRQQGVGVLGVPEFFDLPTELVVLVVFELKVAFPGVVQKWCILDGLGL